MKKEEGEMTCLSQLMYLVLLIFLCVHRPLPTYPVLYGRDTAQARAHTYTHTRGTPSAEQFTKRTT